MTEPAPAFQFYCCQQISAPSSNLPWSETLSISVTVFSEAFSSGWVRAQFGKDARAFLVLLAIAMHARPLRGRDLAQMIQFGIARPDDEHRLYARITDSGLADELDMHRDTVARCTRALASRGLLVIGQVPEGVRLTDSRGSYAGCKVYLLSGQLQHLLAKRVHRRGDRHACCAEASGAAAGNFRTNPESLRESGEVNGEEPAGQPLERIFSVFSQHQGRQHYLPSPREQAAAAQLLADGFCLETEILPGIAAAFQSAPSPVRYFTYCAQVIRGLRRSLPPSFYSGTGQLPGGLEEVAPPAHLARAAGVVARMTAPADRDCIRQLAAMAQGCDGAAQVNGSSGGEWLADALEIASVRARPQHLLAYAGRILESWQRDGRPAPGSPANGPGPKPLSPELTRFQQATGRLPLRDQVAWVEHVLRECRIDDATLRTYWEDWVRRDRKRSDLTWLQHALEGTQLERAAAQNELDHLLRNLEVLGDTGGQHGRPE